MNQAQIDNLNKTIQRGHEGCLGAYNAKDEQCVYQDDKGRNCGIGAMFSPEMMDRLLLDDGAMAEGADGETILDYLEQDGIDFTPQQLVAIQTWHDAAAPASNIMPSNIDSEEDYTLDDFVMMMEMLRDGEIVHLRNKAGKKAIDIDSHSGENMNPLVSFWDA